MKYCEKCGNQLLDEAVMCPKCKNVIGSTISMKEENDIAKSQVKGAIYIIAAIALVLCTILYVVSYLN